MVVFTCSYCGDSVKKNQVEKHYTFACRGRSPALTCVDCLKDFHGEQHVSHTSCVTEEERYSAKGFVSKPPSNKGKKKQEQWVNNINNVLHGETKLDPDVRSLLNTIAGDSCIPQKKNKFINFCTNKFKSFKLHTFERVWEVLEKIKQEQLNSKTNVQDEEQNMKSSEEEVTQEDRKRKRMDSTNSEINIVTANTVKASKKNKKQKKEKQVTVKDQSKKSKKKKKDVTVSGCHSDDADGLKTGENKSKKNEVKGKDESEGSQVEVDETTQVIENGHSKDNLTKKEKKEKRKREKYEKQLMEIQSEMIQNVELEGTQEENEAEETEKGKKKKKHMKDIKENGDANSADIMPAEETKAKKKKKKHQEQEHLSEDNETKNTDTKEINNSKDEAENVQPSGKFNWEETVVKVLESKGELPLKRLEKKVVNEYVHTSAHVESIEKVIAKFHKKILKMPRIKVKKEIAKLVS